MSADHGGITELMVLHAEPEDSTACPADPPWQHYRAIIERQEYRFQLRPVPGSASWEVWLRDYHGHDQVRFTRPSWRAAYAAAIEVLITAATDDGIVPR